jgi:hypothetical protein
MTSPPQVTETLQTGDLQEQKVLTKARVPSEIKKEKKADTKAENHSEIRKAEQEVLVEQAVVLRGVRKILEITKAEAEQKVEVRTKVQAVLKVAALTRAQAVQKVEVLIKAEAAPRVAALTKVQGVQKVAVRIKAEAARKVAVHTKENARSAKTNQEIINSAEQEEAVQVARKPEAAIKEKDLSKTKKVRTLVRKHAVTLKKINLLLKAISRQKGLKIEKAVPQEVQTADHSENVMQKAVNTDQAFRLSVRLCALGKTNLKKQMTD